MIVTEETAKTKWCPFVRHGYGAEGIGINRLHGQSNDRPQLTCIGSACMAWRWVKPGVIGMCGMAGPSMENY